MSTNYNSRRLLYVGMTRAKATLNITHAENRMVAGMVLYSKLIAKLTRVIRIHEV